MSQIVVAKMTDWQPLAKQLIEECLKEKTEDVGASIIVLTGDLGAGKTTLAQVLARELGVADSVQSPTYTIMKSYKTMNPHFKEFIHMDAYRIESETELRPLRFAELVASPHTLFCIEWGERIESVLPAHTIHVSINHQQDDIRLVTIERN